MTSQGIRRGGNPLSCHIIVDHGNQLSDIDGKGRMPHEERPSLAISGLFISRAQDGEAYMLAIYLGCDSMDWAGPACLVRGCDVGMRLGQPDEGEIERREGLMEKKRMRTGLRGGFQRFLHDALSSRYLIILQINRIMLRPEYPSPCRCLVLSCVILGAHSELETRECTV